MDVLETKYRGHACYARHTEWRRDKTIPWDTAYVTGTIYEDIGPGLLAGTVIYSGHMSTSAWAQLDK